MRAGTYRTAKRGPFIASVPVTATGAAWQNAQTAQGTTAEVRTPPAQSDGAVAVIDIFTGANPVTLYFKDIDGSVGPVGIPLPASFFYSFEVTGLYSMVFVGAAISTVTVAVWQQEDSEPSFAPAQQGEALERLVNKLDRIFPDGGVDI